MTTDIIYQRNERIVKKVNKKINGKNVICVLKENVKNPFEAEMMIYVKENTNIPVPKVFDYGKNEQNNNYILMEYIEGDILENVFETLNNDEKDKIINQLKEYIYEMREKTFSNICSINNNPCHELSISNDLFGPFREIEEFNNYRINKLIIDDEEIKIYINTNKNIKTDFILTHNDLGPYNIIVKDNNIVAILDWELSGYYPEYWEYNRTYFHCGYTDDWKEILNKIIKMPSLKIISFEKIMYCLDIYSNLYNDEDIREKYKEIAKIKIKENKEI